MTKIIATVLGTVSLLTIGACADGSIVAAERATLDEVVSLDEAVVEVEASDELEIETGLEVYTPAQTEPEADVVDLDLASDSG